VSVDRSAAARSSTTAKIRSKEEKRGTRKDPSSGPGLTARTQITVPTVVQQWCSAPSSAADTSSSLEGGEDGGDDDDNIAYSAVVALVPEEAASAPPSHSVFSHSLLHAGQTVSLTALHLPSLSALFVFLKSGDMASISKECFVSLLEHAEEELRCKTVYVFFEQCVSAELRRQILHSFHLMGFQIVPPSDPTVSLVGSQYYFMSYELEDSDDDED
jgi:hypothetical protein